jgi:hypothetical protein
LSYFLQCLLVMPLFFQFEAMQSLLLTARAYVAVHHWTAALPYVLSSLLHATNLNHDLLAAEALTALTEIWAHLSPTSERELQLILMVRFGFFTGSLPTIPISAFHAFTRRCFP